MDASSNIKQFIVINFTIYKLLLSLFYVNKACEADKFGFR